METPRYLCLAGVPKPSTLNPKGAGLNHGVPEAKEEARSPLANGLASPASGELTFQVSRLQAGNRG